MSKIALSSILFLIKIAVSSIFLTSVYLFGQNKVKIRTDSLFSVFYGLISDFK
ncbi:hypothetical protein [Treponema pedis]|uniref:Uncharacterized protein n=1 Tax=Treponema pedis str. T A4 TaxID=1291379 RepID=S6A1U6_9SPIR|nr:hypothetical protein [Treponema pedis]AGT44913.1 hypothetical protein TPE_2439 [Treponema pedis str. T A4]